MQSSEGRGRQESVEGARRGRALDQGDGARSNTMKQEHTLGGRIGAWISSLKQKRMCFKLRRELWARREADPGGG